jgi:UPF0755 protein
MLGRIVDLVQQQRGRWAVTDSNTPPGGSKRTASRLRATVPSPVKTAEPKSSGSGKPRSEGSPPPLNGATPAPRVSTSKVVPRAAAAAPLAPGRLSAAKLQVVPPATEPYSPLSERTVDAIRPASMTGQPADAKRISPRSPRQALEPDRVEIPEERRRSKRARHPLVIAGNAVITLFLILAVAASYLLYIGKQRFDAPGPLQQDSVVNIPRGSGIRDISDLLTREGVIDQPWVFIGGVLALKAHEGLKAGEYEFKAHASLSDVVETLSEGKVVVHQISIPEGLTSEQIVARLMDNDVLTGNIDEIPAEGSLLPDTYNFTRGMSRAQLIEHMQHAQERLVKEIWDRRAPDLPLKTPEQLVILASLIEKETGKPDERTRIAAVFVNRLKQRMRLQSDPTIIYGLVGGKGTLGRPIMKSEIDQPTPYNTYQIDGLPPGPITNPGRAALEAAANPARTRDLYFVADGTGGHVFAETYEQHEKNVTRLRQLEAGQNQSSAAGQSAAPAQDAAAPTPAAPAPQASPHRKPRRKQPQTTTIQ